MDFEDFWGSKIFPGKKFCSGGFCLPSCWPSASIFGHPGKIACWVVVSNIFLMFTPKMGEDEPNLTFAYFSDGWFNHQLEKELVFSNPFSPKTRKMC